MIELYSSVITGFEAVAVEEISSNLHANPIKSRGHVRFETDLNRIPEVLRLRSIDNLYAVLYDYSLEGLCNAAREDALDMIRNEVSRINWKVAVECWQMAHGRSVPGGVEVVKEKMREFVRNGGGESDAEDSFSFR
ncbi:hypothetical protein GCK32_001178 [Trichostrongylus colubriformis]|uniref:Uncharacterized protein n=1 Tax=Trichostrongylus colubriformis TaxID=6319 RepID=A0AAN8EZR1_TRICO